MFSLAESILAVDYDSSAALLQSITLQTTVPRRLTMAKVINIINEDIVGVSSTSGTNINTKNKFSFVNMANKRKTDKNVCAASG